jgi:riboflavin synthase
MFTGLVQDTAKIIGISSTSGGKKMEIETHMSQDIEVGESVSLNGVCLTITETNMNSFSVTLSKETLTKTNFSRTRPGEVVNIERALKLSDRIGGHIVQGHVDGQGRVISKKKHGDSIILGVSLPKELIPYVVPKGSIAINGVSLTVATLNNNWFTSAIVPYTQKKTNLGRLNIGDFVNIEVDIIGKYLISSKLKVGNE